ncbi:hypothetical protein ACSA002_1980 [Salmonella phage vB_SalM_SA002]|nr:hypothetical protein ACSA002_1980 [Salmonella phage vB_SalM_SA002]
MSFNNVILGLGLEAFEDQPEAFPVPADQVYADPVPAEEANILVVERNSAIEERDFVESGAALNEDLVETQVLISAEEQLDRISASMESYVESGTISRDVAVLLQGQLAAALEAIGADLTDINAGMESLDDNEAVVAYFATGLEALNDAKGTIGSKIAGAIVQMNLNIMRRLETSTSRFARLRTEANAIITEAKGASGSRSVSVSNKFLATKKNAASTNLPGDLSQFTGFVNDLVSGYLSKAATYANGPVVGALAKLKTVKTLSEAKAVADTLQPPPYPGASVAIKETPKLSLKRTDVTLGGYAVFDLRYKASPGETAPEITSQIKTITMNRLSLKRAKDEKGGKVVFEATLTPADAVKIANEVVKCCAAAENITRNMQWGKGLGDKVRAHVQALNTAIANTDNDAEKGVGAVIYTVCKLPEKYVNAMANLVFEVPDAVNNVCTAALKVAAAAAKGSEGSSSSEE